MGEAQIVVVRMFAKVLHRLGFPVGVAPNCSRECAPEFRAVSRMFQFIAAWVRGDIGMCYRGGMTEHRICSVSVASVYPNYIAKAERKGRTKAEVDEIIR